MTRRALLVGSAACRALRPAARATTNFSGKWVIDHSQSKNAPFTKLEYVITHRDPRISYSIVAEAFGSGNLVRRFVCTTDGKECSNTVRDQTAQGTISSTMRWEGDILMVSSKRSGTDVNIKEEWSLSPDGKRLIIERQQMGVAGKDTRMKIVLVRQ